MRWKCLKLGSNQVRSISKNNRLTEIEVQQLRREIEKVDTVSGMS